MTAVRKSVQARLHRRMLQGLCREGFLVTVTITARLQRNAKIAQGYSGEEDVVDERGRFVSCQCSPARQPTNSGIFFVHYLVLWVTDSVVMWFKMLSTSEINKKSLVNAFHAFKCRSVARREYFGTEICFHLLPSTRFISLSLWDSLRYFDTVLGRPYMFFNHPKSDFILVRSLQKFSPVIDYELKLVKMQLLVKSISLWQQ